MAPADAGARPGLQGRRGRPARHRTVRQAPGRLRHRNARRRPCRADGRARPPAVRHGRHATPDCRSATPWPPITPTGSTAWPSPRPRSRACLPAAAVPSRAAQRTAVAHRLQPAPSRSTSSSSGDGRTSSSARSSRLGRDEEAARRRRQVLRRPARAPTRRRCAAASSSTALSTPPPRRTSERKTRRLTMPVLAIGGAESFGEASATTMKLVADDVQTVVLPGAATGSPSRRRTRCSPR